MVTKVGLYRCKSGTQTKWRVRWFGRYDPQAGRQKRYSKTFDRRRDAEEFQKQKENQFGEGVKRDPSQETLRGYAERWLQYRVGFGGIQPATAQSYRETFARLYDFFGPGRLLRTIDQGEVMEFLSSLRPKNANRKEPLSNWARHRVLRECSCLFSKAAKDGIVPVNPFKDAEKPKLPETEWYYLRPDEFQRVLEVTPTLREKALYVLAYTAGLRRNKAISLYWTNIDFDEGQVKIVNRSAAGKYPPFRIKDHEKRDIPIPAFTCRC